MDGSCLSIPLAIKLVQWISIPGARRFSDYANILPTSRTMLVNYSHSLLDHVDGEEQQVDVDIGQSVMYMSDPSLKALRLERQRFANRMQQLSQLHDVAMRRR